MTFQFTEHKGARIDFDFGRKTCVTQEVKSELSLRFHRTKTTMIVIKTLAAPLPGNNSCLVV